MCHWVKALDLAVANWQRFLCAPNFANWEPNAAFITEEFR